jgi:hypothetical protein
VTRANAPSDPGSRWPSFPRFALVSLSSSGPVWGGSRANLEVAYRSQGVRPCPERGFARSGSDRFVAQ